MRMPDNLAEDAYDGWLTSRLFREWVSIAPEFNTYYRPEETFVVFQAILDASLISHAQGNPFVGVFPVRLNRVNERCVTLECCD